MTSSNCIELGSGDGYFSVQLEKIIDLLATDKSQPQLDRNLAACKKATINAAQTGHKDCEFDISFEANMLHHAENEKDIAREMIRLSTKHIIVLEPNPFNPLNFLLGLLLKHERKSLKFTKSYVNKLFSHQNFRLIKSYSFGVVPPNSCPLWLWRILKPLERPLGIIGIDNIYIFQKF